MPLPKGDIPPALLGSLFHNHSTVLFPVFDVHLETEKDRVADARRNQQIREQIDRFTEHTFNEIVTSLRNDGVSEEQLSMLVSTIRMGCLLQLLENDLEGVVLEHVATDGQSSSLRDLLVRILVPELAD